MILSSLKGAAVVGRSQEIVLILKAYRCRTKRGIFGSASSCVERDAIFDPDRGERTAGANRGEALLPQREVSTQGDADLFYALYQKPGSSSFT